MKFNRLSLSHSFEILFYDNWFAKSRVNIFWSSSDKCIEDTNCRKENISNEASSLTTVQSENDRQTPGRVGKSLCIKKQSGFVSCWSSRKNVGSEPSEEDTCQQENRLWHNTRVLSMQWMSVRSLLFYLGFYRSPSSPYLPPPSAGVSFSLGSPLSGDSDRVLAASNFVFFLVQNPAWRQTE